MQVMTKPITLAPAFIAEVKKEIKPHWGELGWVTYKRTYARWLPDVQRTENWDETVKRVVEGNINLDPRLHTAIPRSLKHCKKKHGIFLS